MAEQTHHRQLTILGIGMELADAFLGVRVEIPLEHAGFLLFNYRVGVGRRRCSAGGTDNHARPVNMQADRSATFFQLG